MKYWTGIIFLLPLDLACSRKSVPTGVRGIVGFRAEEDSRMKGERYGEEQVVRIFEEVEGGEPVADACREHGDSEQSVHRWRTK